MFERSLLIDHGGVRKSASFVASLTAQILMAGVLLVAPLFYHKILPVLRFPEPVPVVGVWRLPEAVAESHHSSRASGLALPSPFHPPTVIRSDYPESGMVIVEADAPAISSALALPSLPIGRPSLPAAEAPRPVPSAVTPTDFPVRVGGDVQSAKLLKRVIPMYPQTARQVRVSGTVHLLGIIAKDGTVQRLEVLSGHPLLRQAALDAVRQWIYRPTILNGEPAEVEAPIDVIFTLQ